MANGLRFFGTDFANTAFGGTTTASSAIANAKFAFDGILGTKWISSGENTDGNEVYVEVDYGFTREVDSFFIVDSNMEDMEIQYDDSGWVTMNSSIATIVKSADLMHMFVKLNASVVTQKIRVVATDTITPNEEKYVSQFLTMPEIGQLEYFPDFQPNISPEQDIFSLTDGRGFVIERGEAFSAKIAFKSHVNQNDINLAETLLSRKEPFHIWANAGDSSKFVYTFKPFRFQDIFKVTIIKKNSPKYTNNYYRGGYNNTLSLIEVT